MNSTEVKRRIILNYITTIMQQPATLNWMMEELDKYVQTSPNEIKLYEEQKELDRIKYSER